MTALPVAERAEARATLAPPPAFRAPVFWEFGTKAETLQWLQPLVRTCTVPELYVFNVGEWNRSPRRVLRRIAQRFGGQMLAVRSSARAEDGARASLAGAFLSRLGVNGADPAETAMAIRQVIASYAGDRRDQILVQPMLRDVAMSGVVMTHDLTDGAPYYVINYDDESGKTDTITGGTGVNKTVFICRNVDPELVESERIRRVIFTVRELETVCGGTPLDVEFCVDRAGEVFLLQVRRISVCDRWQPAVAQRVLAELPRVEALLAARSAPPAGVTGRRTMYGVMPDWNPAEIIGTTPGRLAISLYRDLVTRSVWSDARARMGYRRVPDAELMVTLVGRPYIDVRNSFNSLIPDGLSEQAAGALVDAWLDRLDQHPELHDKVEFEVAQSCLDFSFDDNYRSRYSGVLSPADLQVFRARFRVLTRTALDLGPRGSVAGAERTIGVLAERQQSRGAVGGNMEGGVEAVARAMDLLDECREMGTLPFAILARHAFIAESLLRSAVQRGALGAERLVAFKRSVRTVSGEFTDALQAVARGEASAADFLRRFGHLRPGTYDIQSPTYANRSGLFRDCIATHAVGVEPFVLSSAEHAALNVLLAEIESDITPDGLLDYARRAIAGREYAKLIFTRNLSDAIELLARWGEEIGLSREDLSHLDLESALSAPARAGDAFFLTELVAAGRAANARARATKLSHLIRDAADLYVVPQHRSLPNFVGSRQLHGTIVAIDARTAGGVSLAGRIVCIENADPGFDWIFGRGIAGLITKYGGANSHMAIRCAEYGLPAAIGCGTQLFERIVAAGAVDLNCAEKTLRPVDEH